MVAGMIFDDSPGRQRMLRASGPGFVVEGVDS